MVSQRKLSSLVLWILAVTSSSASAQTLGQREVFLSAGETTRSNSAGIDYVTFAYELVAFVTKEILPDSHDEYPESPLGSRLSRDMAERDSAFGKHCLTVVSQVGAALPWFSSRSLALRQIWSAFKNDVEDNRRGLSLNPKVGAHKIGVNLTLHW